MISIATFRTILEGHSHFCIDLIRLFVFVKLMKGWISANRQVTYPGHYGNTINKEKNRNRKT